MSNEELQKQIISDLEKDFPNIKEIKNNENEIIIKADTNTLWEIFEILYQGLSDVELNLDKEEEAHILIKI